LDSRIDNLFDFLDKDLSIKKIIEDIATVRRVIFQLIIRDAPTKTIIKAIKMTI
jgi:hypothetical protein